MVGDNILQDPVVGGVWDKLNEPIPGFRFSVWCYNFDGGLGFKTPAATVLDMNFQKVSGLSAEVETEILKEGGQNLYKQKLPLGVNYDNLVLERGIVVGPSVLNSQLKEVFSEFKFQMFNVLVMLNSEVGIPIAAWNFCEVYPVKLSTSDLDAEPSLLIDTMELAYTRMVRKSVGSLS